MWVLGSSKKLPSYIYDKIIVIIYVTSVGFFLFAKVTSMWQRWINVNLIIKKKRFGKIRLFSFIQYVL